jgi:RNA polymerase sigma factor (sigma-70 family)
VDRSSFAGRAVRLLGPLLNYARAELASREAAGDLPVNWITAEDVMDEALLAALGRAGQAPEHGLYAWLRAFVRSAIDRAVRDSRRREAEPLDEPLGGPQDVDQGLRPRRLADLLENPGGQVPDEVVETEEFQGALLAILRQLPEDWREPFLLSVREGIDMQEISAAEGVPVAEVERRIAMAREFLRARLADEYRDVAATAPTDAIFAVLQRVEPSSLERARIRDTLKAGVETASPLGRPK